VRVPERSAHVLVDGVVDGAMTGELAAEGDIDRVLVGHQVALAAGLSDQNLPDVLRGDVGDMEGTDAAVTLHKSHDGLFLRRGLVGAVLGFAADKGLV